ncbi:hypothetical protein BKA70DRAFT_1323936, partial [Coprinopsis sp. MPI-PUGE-AT-0042]
LASPIIQTINLNMRFSFLTFLLAASTAVVSAYDFDSRVVSSRDVSDSSSSLRLNGSMAAVNAKKALERLQKNKAGSMSGKKKEEMRHQEIGAFRAIAMGSRDPARQRKPATAPCVYKGNGSFTTCQLEYMYGHQLPTLDIFPYF